MFKGCLAKHVKERDPICSWQTFWSSSFWLGTTDEVNTSRLAFRGMFQQYKFPVFVWWKIFRCKYAFNVPSWYITHCQQASFWGIFTVVDGTKWKMTVYNYKIVRTQLPHPIWPKPNSEFLIARYCCVPDTILYAKDFKMNRYTLDEVLNSAVQSEEQGLGFMVFRSPFLYH